ncbi:alpha/beta fold hydrolase [Sporobolomyces salmoneus]|uniref:alpha/beta fold hydrolase n=1 Tax=Sporobolomyces salmoneus TaxID=183962 RepID=UPI00317FA1BB
MPSPRACSLFSRSDGFTFGYKVLSRHLLPFKTPLVLVTGLIDWFPLAASLALERPVLVFDNRGIGSSTIPASKKDEQYNVQDMANDAISLIQHLNWTRIDILGFSMGGMIVSTLLVTPHLPFTVEHAILTATSAKRAHSDLLKAIPQGGGGTGKELSREEKRKLVEPFTYVNYSPEFVKNPKNRALLDRRINESIDSRRPARTVQQQVAVIAGYDVRKQLPSIPSTLPILILHGTLDRSVYYTEAKYLTQGLKHAKLQTFEGVGHMQVPLYSPPCFYWRLIGDNDNRWYDYYTTSYWSTLLNTFLSDPKGGDVSSLNAPTPSARL